MGNSNLASDKKGHQSSSQDVIPRIIWTYWNDGLERAPKVVQLCVESWSALNPDFELRVLSRESVWCDRLRRELADFDRIPPQKQSNLVRLETLSLEGGVWVDATLFCRMPLNEWLPRVPRGGAVFCENFPHRKDRIIANFFLAATANHRVVARWHAETMSLFAKKLRHEFSERNGVLLKKLGKLSGRCPLVNSFWTGVLNSRVAKVYPYFIHHYILASLVDKDPLVRESWAQSGKLKLGTWPLTFNSVWQAELDHAEVRIRDILSISGVPFHKVSYKLKEGLDVNLPLLMDELRDWLSLQKA